MAKKRQPGGQPVYTKEIADLIIELVGQGHFLETACCFAGVSVRAVRYWMSDGRRAKHNTKFKAFYKRIEQARAKAEIDDLNVIKRAEQWQAAAWRLERRNHKNWVRKDGKEPPPAIAPLPTMDEVKKEIQEVLGSHGNQRPNNE